MPEREDKPISVDQVGSLEELKLVSREFKPDLNSLALLYAGSDWQLDETERRDFLKSLDPFFKEQDDRLPILRAKLEKFKEIVGDLKEVRLIDDILGQLRDDELENPAYVLQAVFPGLFDFSNTDPSRVVEQAQELDNALKAIFGSTSKQAKIAALPVILKHWGGEAVSGGKYDQTANAIMDQSVSEIEALSRGAEEEHASVQINRSHYNFLIKDIVTATLEKGDPLGPTAELLLSSSEARDHEGMYLAKGLEIAYNDWLFTKPRVEMVDVETVYRAHLEDYSSRWGAEAVLDYVVYPLALSISAKSIPELVQEMGLPKEILEHDSKDRQFLQMQRQLERSVFVEVGDGVTGQVVSEVQPGDAKRDILAYQQRLTEIQNAYSENSNPVRMPETRKAVAFLQANPDFKLDPILPTETVTHSFNDLERYMNAVSNELTELGEYFPNGCGPVTTFAVLLGRELGLDVYASSAWGPLKSRVPEAVQGTNDRIQPHVYALMNVEGVEVRIDFSADQYGFPLPLVSSRTKLDDSFSPRLPNYVEEEVKPFYRGDPRASSQHFFRVFGD